MPWAPYHGERSGIKLHVAYTPVTEMPFQVKETTGLVHDGPAGISLADSDFILVQDRAYGKHKQLDVHEANGQRFVIRLKDNIEFHRPYSLQRFSPAASNVTGDITCRLGTKQSRTENRFRVVSFTDREGHLMHIATNVTELSAEEIAGMYQTRWKIESFFQWIKGQLNVPTLFGKSQNAVFSQLFVALITYILIKWTFEEIKVKATKSLSQKGFKRLFLCDDLPIDWQNALAEWLYRLKDEVYLGNLNFG
nr:IS4 family transposase [Jeotgalibacillus malaysiensis]